MALHKDAFSYLRPTDRQVDMMDELRGGATQYAKLIDIAVPDGPDKTYILATLARGRYVGERRHHAHDGRFAAHRHVQRGSGKRQGSGRVTMPIGLIFWVLMLLWILAVIGRRWGGPNMPWAEPAGDLIILILFFLLGWHDFGFIVHP